MAVPKRKISKRRRGNRRSHHAIGRPNLRPCSNCGAYELSHRICKECGYYKGRVVLPPKVKKIKEESS